jgi:hypothetical protein
LPQKQEQYPHFVRKISGLISAAGAGFAYLLALVWVVIEADTCRKLIVPKLIAAAPI